MKRYNSYIIRFYNNREDIKKGNDIDNEVIPADNMKEAQKSADKLAQRRNFKFGVAQRIYKMDFD